MKKINLINTLFIAIMAFSCKGQQKLSSGMYAEFQTSKGKIVCVLEYKKTPMTVANFVSLAEGTMNNNKKENGVPFYDSLKFHRVIPEFMIQGGCPDGTGAGSPGYQFPDECHPDLKHDGAGILSMANSDPQGSKKAYSNVGMTNGSQFFITHKETPWLDGFHTVFGHVIEGMDVVNKIEGNDVMQKVTIIRLGKEAKKFNANEVFEAELKKAKVLVEENLVKVKIEEEKRKAEAAEKLKKIKEGATVTASGLAYKVMKKGTGKVHPNAAQTVTVHYTGKLLNGKVFDSSVERGQPASFPLNRVIPGWTEGVQLMVVGDKFTFIIPSALAYGERGAGGVIPPNADLIFEVELLEIKAEESHDGHDHDGHDH